MTSLLPHPRVKEPETLLDYEILMFLEAARTSGIRDYTMISFCLATGLRCSELVNLTIECIRAYEAVTCVLMLPGTIAKGGNSRDIPIKPDLRIDLEFFLSWKETNNEPLELSDPLFVSKYTHNKLNPRDFQRIVKKLSLKSINRAIHPHILRHTFATRLLAVSNLRIVQKVLGHKNIQTTQIYTHISNEQLKAIKNPLDEL